MIAKIHVTKNKFFVFCFLLITAFSTIFLFSKKDNYRYYFHQDDSDSFMDLFNSVVSWSRFGKHSMSNYPPFAELPYAILGNMIPVQAENTTEQAYALRASVPGAFLLMLHILLFILPFFLLCFFYVEGDNFKKIALSSILSMSGIVLWSLQRGNIIVFAFLFAFLFVILYDSESSKKRFFACVCLAIAASLKLYPGVFGLLLLEKRDWKGMAVCALTFLILYVGAFFACGYTIDQFGDNFKIAFEWAKENSGDSSISIPPLVQQAASSEIAPANSTASVEPAFVDDLAKPNSWVYYAPRGLNVSMKNFVIVLNKIFFRASHGIIPFFVGERFCAVIPFITLCCGIFSFFFLKDGWKKLLAMSLMCVYVPEKSGLYSVLFALVPLIVFLNDNSLGKKNYVYALLFAVIISMLIIPVEWFGRVHSITLGFLLQCGCLFAFFVLLFIEASSNALKMAVSRKL